MPVVTTDPPSTPPKSRRSAVIAIHGIGQQGHFDTIDSIAKSICGDDGAVSIQAEMEPMDRSHDVIPRVRVQFDSTGHQVDIYEVYWAPLTEGRVSLREVVGFLLTTAIRGFITTRDHESDRFLFGKREYFPSPKALGWQLASVLLLLASLLTIGVITAGVIVSLNPFSRAGDNFFATLLPHLTNDLLPLVLFAVGTVLIALVYGFLLRPCLNSRFLRSRATKIVEIARKILSRAVFIYAWLIVLCCLDVAMAFVWHVLGNRIAGLYEVLTAPYFANVLEGGAIAWIIAILLARAGRSSVRAAARAGAAESRQGLGVFTKSLLVFQGIFTLAAAGCIVGAVAVCSMAFVWDGWSSLDHTGRVLPGPGLFMQLDSQPSRQGDVPIFASDLDLLQHFLDDYVNPNHPEVRNFSSLTALVDSHTDAYFASRDKELQVIARRSSSQSLPGDEEELQRARQTEQAALKAMKDSDYPWPLIRRDAPEFESIMNLQTILTERASENRAVDPISTRRFGLTAYELFLVRRLIAYKYDVLARGARDISDPGERHAKLVEIGNEVDLRRDTFDASHGALGALSHVEEERYLWQYGKATSPWHLVFLNPGWLHFLRFAAWASVVLFILLLNKILVGYVGDVVVYLSASSLSRFSGLRERIKDEALRVAKYVYGSEEGINRYEDVIVVGHSLGSVIGYDILNSLMACEERLARDMDDDNVDAGKALAADCGETPREVAGRTKCFITFGSPLDKTAFIFRAESSESSNVREMLAAELQPMIRSYKHRPRHWVNIYSRSDVLSSRIETYDALSARSLENGELDLTKDGFERLWEPFPTLRRLLRRKGVDIIALEESLESKGLNMDALDDLLRQKKLNILALEALLTKKDLDVTDLQEIPDAQDLNALIFSRVVENVEDLEADWPFLAHTMYWRNRCLRDVLHAELFTDRWVDESKRGARAPTPASTPPRDAD